MEVANVHRNWMVMTSIKRQKFKTMVEVKYLWQLAILRARSRPGSHAPDLSVETLSLLFCSCDGMLDAFFGAGGNHGQNDPFQSNCSNPLGH
jgi:hypothetical protein